MIHPRWFATVHLSDSTTRAAIKLLSIWTAFGVRGDDVKKARTSNYIGPHDGSLRFAIAIVLHNIGLHISLASRPRGFPCGIRLKTRYLQISRFSARSSTLAICTEGDPSCCSLIVDSVFSPNDVGIGPTGYSNCRRRSTV